MLKVTVIGNLGGDPEELRYNANGNPFVRFNVAANYRVRTQEGEWQDKTEWLRVIVGGKRAEFLSQYLRKGTKVYVEGRLEASPWIDNQQQPRAGLTVLANDVEFMSSRSDDEGSGLRVVDSPRAETAGAPAQPASAQPARAAGPRSQPPPGDDSELEDLPF
jgi:single-strand DNA-binding protein